MLKKSKMKNKGMKMKKERKTKMNKGNIMTNVHNDEIILGVICMIFENIHLYKCATYLL